MKVPACDQVLGDGEVWKSVDVVPCFGTHEKATSWTPSRIDAISGPIFSTSTSCVTLIEWVIVRHIIVELSLSALQQLSGSGNSYLGTGNHSDSVVFKGIRDQRAKDVRFRHHVGVKDSEVLTVARWQFLDILRQGAVQIAGFVPVVDAS